MKKRYYVNGAVIALWVVLVSWVAPHLIRQAYLGKSLSFLNARLSGRNIHSLQFYLDVWRGKAWTVTAMFVAVLGCIDLSLAFPEARRAVIGWIVGSEHSLAAVSLLWYAAFWGACGGLAEAAFRTARQLITHEPPTGFFPALIWMAPVSAGFVALVVGGVLVAAARAGRTRVGVWKATLLLAFLAVFGVFQPRGIPLHPLAKAILSLGLALVAGRAAEAHAGQLERLIRRGRRYFLGGFAVLAVYAIVILPSVTERWARWGRAAAAGERPNVLLIILDTVRAANLGLYGYDRPTTPSIDAWAKSGVVFDMALASAPWTLPSHATMLTGRYNFELHTNSLTPLGATFPTLAEVLDRHGYATAGFVGNLVFTTRTSGLQRGFDRYEDYPLTLGTLVGSSWLSKVAFRPLKFWTGGVLGFGTKDAEEVTREFLRWTHGRRKRPFFAFLNYFDAHEPYPLTPYSTFGSPATEDWTAFSNRWRSHPDSRPFSVLMQPWVNQYDGAVAYIDHELGIILDTLRARGTLKNTLVIVTADHGESFGEHGLISHRNSLYLPQLHVPLVLSLPGTIPPNVRVPEAVSQRDLAATVLDVVGIHDAPIPGHSMAALWSGGPAVSRRSPRLAELEREADNRKPWAPVSRGDMETLFEGELHYIRNGDHSEELYDIGQDPGELQNLATQPQLAPVLAGLRSRLDSITGPRGGRKGG